jgi:hypothetical protein
MSGKTCTGCTARASPVPSLDHPGIRHLDSRRVSAANPDTAEQREAAPVSNVPTMFQQTVLIIVVDNNG